MRHEQIRDKGSYARVDVAAVWPASARIAPPPVPEPEANVSSASFAPTPAAPDVPASVGGLIAASYFILISTFAIATAGSARSIFAIAIIYVFATAFFAVPRIFFGIEPASGRRPTLQAFLDRGMETATGHSGGAAALVQMLIVPVLLTFGALGMGIAAAIIM